MEKGLIDIIDERIQSIKDVLPYAKKGFPTERHKEIYMLLRKSYLVSLWLILTIGFTGIHCLYCNSKYFYVYFFCYVFLMQYFDKTVPQSFLILSIIELVRVPIALYIYNLRVKKAVLENADTMEYCSKFDVNHIYIMIAIILLSGFFAFYSFDIFYFWKIFLNLHN